MYNYSHKVNNMEIFNLLDSHNLEGIRAWVKNENTNKNVTGEWRETPLHYAINMRNEKAAEIFVENHFYIKSVDYNNNMPLHLAAYNGLGNLTLLLIKRGAIINIENKYGNTPLYYAAGSGKSHVALVLIQNGAKINFFDDRKITPLNCAIYWSKDIETVKTLLNEGASLLTHDNSGNHYLSLMHNENIILLLKYHLKLQKYVVCRKKLFLNSRVFLKFLNTFKFSFTK